MNFLNFTDVTFLAAFWAVLPIITLAALVYARGQRGPYRRIFILSSVVFAFWATANYFSLQSSDWTLFWARLVLFFAVLLLFTFLLLVYSFSENFLKTRGERWLIGVLAVFTAIAMIAAETPFVFKEVVLENGAVTPVPGSLIPLFAFTILILFALGGVKLLREVGKTTGIQRAQLTYLLVGYFSMFVLLITTQFLTVALFQNTSLLKFGPLFALPFPVFTTYAILKHNLFNIRVILTEIFTVVVILVFLINIFFSESLSAAVINSVLFVFATIFGILLIRGTIREIRSLQELSDAKSEFVSIASHQLRTPLTAIKGYISLLLEGTYGSVSEAQKEPLAKVYTSNERLIRLVNDLLDLSRIEQGKWQYNLAKVAVSPMIASIVGELKIAAQSKNLSLHFQKPSHTEKILIWADEEKFRQSVLNLIDNAIKYTEKGGIEVHLEADINPTLIKISVRDTGIGLSADDKSRIFQRFSRGKDSFKINTGGTGLGLFVAKKIVEDHGGRIFAESPGLGKGSTFIILVPFYREKDIRQ